MSHSIHPTTQTFFQDLSVLLQQVQEGKKQLLVRDRTGAFSLEDKVKSRWASFKRCMHQRIFGASYNLAEHFTAIRVLISDKIELVRQLQGPSSSVALELLAACKVEKAACRLAGCVPSMSGASVNYTCLKEVARLQQKNFVALACEQGEYELAFQTLKSEPSTDLKKLEEEHVHALLQSGLLDPLTDPERESWIKAILKIIAAIPNIIDDIVAFISPVHDRDDRAMVVAYWIDNAFRYGNEEDACVNLLASCTKDEIQNLLKRKQNSWYLNEACRQGFAKVVELLLENGLKPKGSGQEYMFHNILGHKLLETAKLLLAHGIEASDEDVRLFHALCLEEEDAEKCRAMQGAFQHCDCTLRIGSREFRINKEALLAQIPFLQDESLWQPGCDTLPDIEASLFQDILDALLGTYKIEEEQDDTRAVALMLQAQKWDIYRLTARTASCIMQLIEKKYESGIALKKLAELRDQTDAFSLGELKTTFEELVERLAVSYFEKSLTNQATRHPEQCVPVFNKILQQLIEYKLTPRKLPFLFRCNLFLTKHLATSSFVDEIIKYCEMVLTLFPGDTETLLVISKLHRLKGDLPLAVNFYQRALDVNPHDVPTRCKLIELLLEEGDGIQPDLEKAKFLIEHVPRPLSENEEGELLPYRAYTFKKSGDLRRAQRILRENNFFEGMNYFSALLYPYFFPKQDLPFRNLGDYREGMKWLDHSIERFVIKNEKISEEEFNAFSNDEKFLLEIITSSPLHLEAAKNFHEKKLWRHS